MVWIFVYLYVEAQRACFYMSTQTKGWLFRERILGQVLSSFDRSEGETVSITLELLLVHLVILKPSLFKSWQISRSNAVAEFAFGADVKQLST